MKPNDKWLEDKEWKRAKSNECERAWSQMTDESAVRECTDGRAKSWAKDNKDASLENVLN